MKPQGSSGGPSPSRSRFWVPWAGRGHGGRGGRREAGAKLTSSGPGFCRACLVAASRRFLPLGCRPEASKLVSPQTYRRALHPPQPQGPATPPSPRMPRRQLRFNISSFSPSPLPASQTQPSYLQMTAPATQPLRPEAGGQHPQGPTSHHQSTATSVCRSTLHPHNPTRLNQGLPASLTFYKRPEDPLHVPIH